QRPRKSVDRVMQELHLLNVLEAVPEAYGQGERWRYHIASGIDTAALAKLARNGGPSSQDDGKPAAKMTINVGGVSAGLNALLARNGGTPAQERPSETVESDRVKPDKPARRKCEAPGCRKSIP